MAPTISTDALHRRWLRAPELDSGGGKVYVPDQGRPSRPRPAIEFRPDGTYEEEGIGPDDRGVPGSGRWELHGDELRLSAGKGRTPVRTLRIVEVTPDRLVVKD